VPGKSSAIIFRTGQVWHPMGIPSGLARRLNTPAEANPAAAVHVAALFRNSLLDVFDMIASSDSANEQKISDLQTAFSAALRG